jgi:hypothetical protein
MAFFTLFAGAPVIGAVFGAVGAVMMSLLVVALAGILGNILLTVNMNLLDRIERLEGLLRDARGRGQVTGAR